MTIRTTLSHVALHVRDLPAMEKFYGDVLGLVVSDRGRASRINCDMVFLSGNPEAHHQVVLMSGRPEEARLNPVNHMSFKIDSLAVLREIRDRATANGVAGLRAVNHGNAWSVYFPDPEGNTIEAFLDTPWHVAQPHGDSLDLDKSDAEILAETQAVCSRDPSFMQRSDWDQAHAARLG
jgi:catechol 2,3-dioxygenase